MLIHLDPACSAQNVESSRADHLHAETGVINLMVPRQGEQGYLKGCAVCISVWLASVVGADIEQLKGLWLRQQICAGSLRHNTFSSSCGFADVAQSVPAYRFIAPLGIVKMRACWCVSNACCLPVA